MPQPSPDATAARIAALERQVAALQAQVGAEPSPAPERFDRRALLRRSGAALAGAVALPALLADPAAAAEGDPLLLGRANDAAATTSLTGGTATGPALQVANPTPAGPYAAPALRLTPGAGADGLDPASAAAGDLASSGDLLWYGHVGASGTGGAVIGAVYTSAFANHLEFLVEPRRVLDTRPGPGIDESGNPNDRASRVVVAQREPGGQLRGGTSLVLDLSGLVRDGAAVFANLTVVAPAGSGFLAAYPTPDGTPRTDGQDRPAVSSLNFVGGTPALANFALVRLGSGGRISLFTTTTAHVLLDVSAVSVSAPFSLRHDAGAPALRQR